MKKNTYYLFGVSAFAITKFRLALIVIFMLFASSSIGFAVWEETSPLNDSHQITIGEGTTFKVVKVTEPPSPNLKLVPLGAFKGNQEVDHYVYKYEVLVNKVGQLHVNSENIQIGDNETLSEMVLFEYATSEDFVEFQSNNFVITLDDTHFDENEGAYITEIFVKVALHHPTSSDMYDAMASKSLYFDLVFRIEEIADKD